MRSRPTGVPPSPEILGSARLPRLLPRCLHPFAWWGWALALAVVASMTTNPLLLGCLVLAVSIVTLARRGDNPWGKGFAMYLWLGAAILVIRVAVRILFGGGDGPTILFHLPEIPLPSWVIGIRLLGPVSLESLLYGFYDGARLATLIICIGAANSLVNPKRLLAALPAALYELGTIVVVSFSLFPQLGESIRRVLRVRKLRKTQAPKNRRQRLGVIETILVPVLSDALERSIDLAASMEARGYGRSGTASQGERIASTALGACGITTLSLWAYVMLASPNLGPSIGPVNITEWTLLLIGIALILASMSLIGKHVQRTRYRPDQWRTAEWLVIACGAVALLIVQLVAHSPSARVLQPSVAALDWPTLTWPLLLVLVMAVMPSLLTPPPALATPACTKAGIT